MTATEHAVSPAAPATFDQVIAAEWASIQERRKSANLDGQATENGNSDSAIAGIALSGGGIRSATFCLGVLQALSRRGVLRGFDYLSTVSGGGFTGSWWSAWIARRAAPGSADRIPLVGTPSLSGNPNAGYKEPFALHHVRLYGNYLTPRKGALSADTWRAATVILRNLFFTWSALLPMLVAVAFAAELVFGTLATAPSAAALICPASPVAQPQASVAQPQPQTRPALTAEQAMCAAVRTPAWKVRLAELALPAAITFAVLLLLSLCWLLYGEGGGLMGLIGVVVAVTVALGTAAVWANLEALSEDKTWETLLLAVVLLALAYAAFQGQRSRSTSFGSDDRRERLVHLQATVTVLLVVGAVCWGIMALGPHATTWLLAQTAHGGGANIGKRLVAWGGLATAAASALGVGIKASPTGAGERGRTDNTDKSKLSWLLGVAPIVVLIALLVLASALADTAVRAVAAEEPRRRLVMIGVVGAIIWCGFALYELISDVHVEAHTDEPRTIRQRASTRWGVVVFCLAATLAAGTITRLSPHAGLLVLAFAAAVASYRVWHLHGPLMARLGTTVVGLTVAIVLAVAWRASGATAAPTAVDVMLPWFAGFVAAVLVVPLWHAQGGNARSYWLAGAALLALAVFAFIAHMTAVIDPGNLLGFAVLRRSDAAMGFAVAAITIVIGVGWMADPNELSLHAFYRDRLIRAYLGASNPEREPKGIGAEVPHAADDLALSAVDNSMKGGPYHLVNTTLNLVGGHDLSTAQRSSECFTLGQHYCGSADTGYRPTAEYMGGTLTLGTAVAVSGAAASPTMGAKTPSSAVTLLMALLNVRLGFWAPNPGGRRWTKQRPRLWPFFLLRESLSQTNAVGAYCYLTDGGHFDNTALYSLVQRGCTSIVVVDCGADPQPCFSDLGDVVRRCRIDFGADIQLNLAPLDPLSGVPVSHFATGRVRYAKAHLDLLAAARRGRALSQEAPVAPADSAGSDQVVGTIVWMKPSVGAPADPADVRQYGKENPGFPQQATTNQWFDEAQFESYRKLGEYTGQTAFPTDVQPAFHTATDVERYFVKLAQPETQIGQALRRLGD